VGCRASTHDEGADQQRRNGHHHAISRTPAAWVLDRNGTRLAHGLRGLAVAVARLLGELALARGLGRLTARAPRLAVVAERPEIEPQAEEQEDGTDRDERARPRRAVVERPR